jgi:hypothetical protein
MPGRNLTASEVAAFNNNRERQWGVSPRDLAVVVAAITGFRRVVSVAKAA